MMVCTPAIQLVYLVLSTIAAALNTAVVLMEQ